MSRCVSCNKILNSRELTRRGVHSGKFLDMCTSCCSDAEIEYFDNQKLPEDDGDLDYVAGESDVTGDDVFNISDFDLLTSSGD